jgi:hypothetical protein
VNDTSVVRGLVSDAIGALSGWHASRWAPDLFGRDIGTELHHTYVVSVPETTPHVRDGRQRVTEGLLVTSKIEVTWAHLLQVDGQSDAYDDMLDAEQELVGALRGIANAHVVITGMTRKPAAEGWILGTVTADVLHRYALA